jgi:hypothetical protein
VNANLVGNLHLEQLEVQPTRADMIAYVVDLIGVLCGLESGSQKVKMAEWQRYPEGRPSRMA